MTRLLVSLLTGAAMLGAGWAAVADSPIAKADEPHGMLIEAVGQPARDLYPVQITEIDEQAFSTDQNAYYVKPGRHTVAAFGQITRENTLASPIERFNNRHRTLTLDVQAGKRYFLSAHVDRHDRIKWELVVSKVEELDSSAGGETPAKSAD